MKATGIIVEYNPFHNGHIYHINKSKELTNADVIVAVMSGHFLQRGEPAILDKWTRTNIAIHSGVDVVFELPTVYATQSAQSFAYGAVSLLDQLQCVHSICFGSELGNIHEFAVIRDLLYDEPFEFKHALQKQLQLGMSYPKAMEQALYTFSNATVPVPTNSLFQANNTLGLMYMLALKQLKSSIVPYTLQRKAATYHQSTITDSSIASATAIRKLLVANDLTTIQSYVPEATYTHLASAYHTPVTLDDFRDILFSSIYTLETTSLLEYIDMDEGLATRIKKYVAQSASVTELIRHIKCKNYTWARIQRVLIHIVLDMKKNELLPLQTTPYARVLGFTKKGQQFLQQAKKRSSIPIIDKGSNNTFPYARYDYLATQIYSLIEHQKRKENITLASLVARDYRLPPIQM